MKGDPFGGRPTYIYRKNEFKGSSGGGGTRGLRDNYPIIVSLNNSASFLFGKLLLVFLRSRACLTRKEKPSKYTFLDMGTYTVVEVLAYFVIH